MVFVTIYVIKSIEISIGQKIEKRPDGRFSFIYLL